ncbi:MAG: outer membrane protein assembly factor BamA [Hyphomicrobiales bacterium]|nr:MAG: outer membrane protein assembly factor BamA [Hyphomicrobiales bacterium]
MFKFHLSIGRLALSALLALPAMGVAAIPASAPAMAQSATIRSIVVEGNRRIEDESVRSYMKIGPGDRYDAGLIDESLKELFETGLFADVTISRRGRTLLVRVVENPIINRVRFEGNRRLKDKELKAAVEMRPRTVFTRAKVQSDVSRLIELYRRNGRFTAKVVPKVIRREQQRVDLVYEINEGPETNVVNITFLGNSAFSDARLRSVVSTSEYSWWNFLSTSDRYDPDRLNFDRELLRRFYLKKGYADFRVVSATAELDRDQKDFLITFTVEEGEKYQFGDIEIDSGIAELDPEILRNEVRTRQGRTYDASDVDKTVENITLEAGKKGFAFAQVRPRPDRDAENKVIGMTYVIEEGPRVYVERINITGNVRTLDRVIRREFRLVEGDAYNKTLINKARKNLLGLDFFKRVDITTDAGSAPDKVILNVHVEEKSTGQISLGVGYSTVEAVVGDVSLTERNLLGRGQYLRLSTSISTKRQQLDLRFTEPYFLGRKIAFGVDIFGTETDLTSSSGFKSRQVGAGLRFGFPLGEDLYLNTRYSLTEEKISGTSQPLINPNGRNMMSSAGYTLSYDTLDNPAKPTTGIKLEFSQDVAGLGGDIAFIRANARAIAYRSLFEDIVGSVRLSGGHMIGWRGKNVRISDSFFKGGDAIRGFDQSGIGPRVIGSGEALGGKTYAIANAEVEFPLGLPKKFGMRGAVFADAGTLFNASKNANAVAHNDDRKIRTSVGASLLWTSPIGPLRFDFAKALSKASYDKTRFFNFTAGVRF